MRLLKEDKFLLAATMRDEFDEAGSPEDWDLGSISYVNVFQAIINRRLDKLPYVHLEISHMCSRMCPREFGGSAEIITATQVQVINTAPSGSCPLEWCSWTRAREPACAPSTAL